MLKFLTANETAQGTSGANTLPLFGADAQGYCVWVVGHYIAEYGDKGELSVWDLQAITTTRELAIKACKDPENNFRHNWFVAPLRLNSVLPEETVEWPDAFYPVGDAHGGEDK